MNHTHAYKVILRLRIEQLKKVISHAQTNVVTCDFSIESKFNFPCKLHLKIPIEKMSELFGDIFAGAGGMDEFEQHVASSSESEGVNQSYRVSTSMDQLKRQASNFVGLRNQYVLLHS